MATSQQLLAVDPVRYQIYDPLTTRPDPARPGHWVRDPFPGQHHSTRAVR